MTFDTNHSTYPATDQLGLGEYEVRSWHSWHRHITLVLAAQTFLTVLRHEAEPVVNGTTPFTSSNNWQSGYVQSAARLIIQLSIWEMKRWVSRLLFPPVWCLEHFLHLSYWRRSHQALARHYHYQK
ncbi:hypothetical protein [Chroogloeocystis siderophila]|uniref:hypothetical protein n=1 Tax=Chroogloeocystis siderophila TaxID=329163 RepID=UPI001160F33A